MLTPDSYASFYACDIPETLEQAGYIVKLVASNNQACDCDYADAVAYAVAYYAGAKCNQIGGENANT